MNSTLFAEVPRWQRWLRSGAFGGSIVVHAIAAMALYTSRPEDARAEQWVEMAVVQPPPPEQPPPPPEPEPEPEPEKPKPKPIEAAAPPPEQAPPPRRAPIRLAQGLSASSFAPGSGTAFDVRAGTTTMMKAGPDTMSLQDAQPCTEAPVAPKIKVRPMMDVPEAAQKAGVEGRVAVIVDIDAEGRVTAARVQKDLGYGTGDACVAAWLKARFRPGSRCGTPLAMPGSPQHCMVDAIE